MAAPPARGADHARVDDRGQTPLAAAVFRQSAGGVRLLPGAGADPDLGRQSARLTAQVSELPETASLLLPPAGG